MPEFSTEISDSNSSFLINPNTMTPKEKTLIAGLGRGLICKTEIPKHEQVWEGTLIMVDTYLSQVEINDKGELYCLDIEDVKPYLRDLSDLDKEIEQDGKKFVPMEALRNLSDYEDYLNEIEQDNYEMKNPHRWYNELVEKLHDWHFNVHNLPETDYIKVTNKNNPY